MSQYTLRCWQRLGDILLCFPAAKFLHDQGYEVFIECLAKYTSIFDTVDYVRPLQPGIVKGESLMMGIHPSSGGTLARYLSYRSKGEKWQDFVYAHHEILATCPKGPPLFTKLGLVNRSMYALQQPFVLVAPYGYSQVTKIRPDVLIDAMRKRHPKAKLMVLTDAPTRSPMHINAFRLSHLPDIINWADDFASINSAPAIIAAGLRKPYLHFGQTNNNGQDDTAYLCQQAQLQPTS
jgi:hypothetical protein